jgi:hypothetical protein
MLDLPRYLLGMFEIALLVSFASLGGAALRFRLLPSFSGAPAHLATAVLALALLIWSAEALGSFGLLEPLPYLVSVVVVGLGLRLRLGGGGGGGNPPPPKPVNRGAQIATLVALTIAAVAVVKFGLEARPKLSTGMTGFDSTWYHGPFAAGFFQSGDTWELHFIAPQFLAWFYPANAEIFHAVGMAAFGRDILSPLLNLGWFIGCLVACWCIGRPYRVAPWSLALGAIALSLPVLSDQAGEARNDIVGIFFLLAAVAVALNAWAAGGGSPASRRSVERSPANEREEGGKAGFSSERPGPELGALLFVGLAAGLAAGAKLNFLLPAAVLVVGFAFIAPQGARWGSLAAAGLAALAGGGYWYLRNLIHTGNPLPWFDSLGPISLPAPNQALGGREGHSVLGYLADGTVWSDWFLPGLHGGLTLLWPLLAGLGLAGLSLCFLPLREALASDEATPDAVRQSSGADGPSESSGFGKLGASRDQALAVAGFTGIAVVVAWLIAPTSASGPEGMPRGFESGLRYLAPALVLGLAVLPAAFLPRVARRRGPPIAEGARSASEHMGEGRHDRTRGPLIAGALALLAAIAIGYPVQRHYLENRYVNPTFAAPGLNAAFKWAQGVDHAHVATTSTRQYPLYGADLSNHVQYIGEKRPAGGFTAPTTCRQWRRLLNAGDYDYAITTRDRVEPTKPPYPDTARWTEGPSATPILRTPPTVVFKLSGPLDPSACPR